ncbi:MAG TPA: hypothetical protein VFI52_05505 [Gemmatimonadaceae bacterium]|nr:hypothetical protein [Gemmatimonadaceae bacterium]
MHQQELARRAWEKAGLYKSKNAKLRAFLAHFDATPAACWPDVANEVRTKYPELKAQLITPLWNSGDRLLRINLLRGADPSQPDELALLQKLAAGLRPERDPVELRVASYIESPEVLSRLTKVPGLSPEMTRSLAQRRQALLAHRVAEQQERVAGGQAAVAAPVIAAPVAEAPAPRPRARRKAGKAKRAAPRRVK